MFGSEGTGSGKGSVNRVQMKEIFGHYATTRGAKFSAATNGDTPIYVSSALATTSVHIVCFPQLLNFLRDFCLVPELTTTRFTLSIFGSLMQRDGGGDVPNANEGIINRRGVVAVDDVTSGLTFAVFLEFLGIVADNVEWRGGGGGQGEGLWGESGTNKEGRRSSGDKKRENGDDNNGEHNGDENDNDNDNGIDSDYDEDDSARARKTQSKLVAFLQWMDTSNGKGKICRARGNRMMPSFALEGLYEGSLKVLMK